MRCKICNSMISHPVWNADLNDWEICPTCLDIINDIFESPVAEAIYDDDDDDPFAPEDCEINPDDI